MQPALGLRSSEVVLVPYDGRWPALFADFVHGVLANARPAAWGGATTTSAP